jgi:sec-independent protein translocase protein TatA
MVSKALGAGLAPPGWYPEPVPFGIQLWELFLLLLVVLLVFGPKRLPEMGRSLGRGMREFKDSVTGKDDSRAELPPAQEDSTVVPAPTRTDEKTTTPS